MAHLHYAIVLVTMHMDTVLSSYIGVHSRDTNCKTYKVLPSPCEKVFLERKQFISKKNDTCGVTWGYRNLRMRYTSSFDTSRKLNLHGQKLRVGVLPWLGIIAYDTVSNEYTGFPIDLLEHLAEQLNFSYSMHEPEDKQWGAMKNGSWNGLVGKLVDKKYDLVIAPLTHHGSRAKVIDMVCPVFQAQTKVVFADPRLTQNNGLIGFDSMDTRFILAALGGFGTTVLVYTTMDIIFEPQRTWAVFLKQLERAIILFASSALKQGVPDHLPRRLPKRIVLAFWWWYCIVFSVTYSGTVIAILADNRPALPFRTIAEMLKQSKFKYGFLGNSVQEMKLQDSNNSEYQQLLASVRRLAKEDPDVLSSDDGVHREKMRTENYAFIETLLPCEEVDNGVLSLKEVVSDDWLCIGLQKNSTLTKDVGIVLDELREYGLLKGLWRRHRLDNRPRNFQSVTQKTMLEFHASKNVFYAVFMGIGISFCALVVENLLSHYKKKQRNRFSK